MSYQSNCSMQYNTWFESVCIYVHGCMYVCMSIYIYTRTNVCHDMWYHMQYWLAVLPCMVVVNMQGMLPDCQNCCALNDTYVKFMHQCVKNR